MRRNRREPEPPTILDRARPYVQRVPSGLPRLLVAALVFGIALVIEPFKTVYGNDGRYRPAPPAEVLDVDAKTVPGKTVSSLQKK